MNNPDFDQLLNQGEKSYESEVGQWWIQQCEDKTHRRAYEKIARKAKEFYQKNELAKPKLICDYACGTGILMSHFMERFPKATYLGLDGSLPLLQRFQTKHPQSSLLPQCSKKKDLVEKVNLFATHLPNFNLAKLQSDLVIWCFPNLIASEEHVDEYNLNGYQNEENIHMAEMLARFREMDPEDEVYSQSEDELFDELLSQRVIHWNLCQLLKKGGHYLKVEYANGSRKDMSLLNRWRSDFCEGTLTKKIKGHKVPPFFKLLSSSYHPSEVILDVYAQTQDPGDQEGGYTISIFEKL